MLLLPHGLEGQGPDHTSGRIERFLQLCAEGSMTVAVPSEPANYFHLLRRHALDGVRRPLVVFTPKSMLRNKAAVSARRRLHRAAGSAPVIDDPRFRDQNGPATGCHDAPALHRQDLLGAGRRPRQAPRTSRRDDTAIVRVEQLYPVPHRQLAAVLERYPNVDDVRWVQEEPANQGAWPYFGLELPEKLPERLSRITRVSRRRMAAPAPGSSKVHEVEQKAIIDKALGSAEN